MDRGRPLADATDRLVVSDPADDCGDCAAAGRPDRIEGMPEGAESAALDYMEILP